MNDNKNNNFEDYLKTIVDFVEEHSREQDVELEKIEIDFLEKTLKFYWDKKEQQTPKKNCLVFSLNFASNITDSIFQLDHIIDNIFGKETKPKHMSLEIKIIGNEFEYTIFENEPNKIKIDKEIKEDFNFRNLIMFTSLYYIFQFNKEEFEEFKPISYEKTLKNIEFLTKAVKAINE